MGPKTCFCRGSREHTIGTISPPPSKCGAAASASEGSAAELGPEPGSNPPAVGSLSWLTA
eukprot:scaffold32169_cov50-Phaeocystis_antarctica.AAC.2